MNLKSISYQKKAGIFYTPEPITQFLAINAISEYLMKFFGKKFHEINDLLNSDNKDELNKLYSIITNLKILDPACGDGAILMETAQILFELKSVITKKINLPITNFKNKADIITNNLYGVDIFEDAIKECKKNLRKWLNSDEKFIYNLNVGNSLIGNKDRNLSEIDLQNKNLLRNCKPFHWSEEFPEIIKDGGFDIILENPPYIFTRGGNFSSQQKNYFQNYISQMGLIQSKKGKQNQSGKLYTYSLFILRSLELLKKGGTLAAIVPNNFLRNTNLDIYREFILSNYSIKKIVDLSQGVFQNVVVSTICLFIDKKKPKNEFKTEIISNVVDLNENFYFKNAIVQSSFLKNKSYVINIYLDELGREICKEMEKGSIGLGGISEYIIEGIICSKKNDLFNVRQVSIDKPFLEGKNIGRFFTKWSGKYVRYQRENLHRARPTEVFTNKKLMVQRISGGVKPLKVNYDPGIFYTFSSINNIIIKNEFRKKYPLKYILLVLNSNLMNWYYAVNFTNKSNLTVNISKTFLEEIPIVKPRDISLFETVADYILFLFQYYNINNQMLIFNKDIIKFFYELCNGIVYELYLNDLIGSNLIRNLKGKWIPINYDDWIRKKFKIMIFKQKVSYFKKIEKENFENVNKSYTNLVKDKDILINLKAIYEDRLVNFIESTN